MNTKREKDTTESTKKLAVRLFSTNELPDISDEDFATAVQPKNVKFIRELCSERTVGRFHWFESMGFVLQNGGNGELRCIYLVDHPDVELDLALIHATIQHVGAKLVFAPYTVVVPFEEEYATTKKAEEDSKPPSEPTQIGMEVA